MPQDRMEELFAAPAPRSPVLQAKKSTDKPKVKELLLNDRNLIFILSLLSYFFFFFINRPSLSLTLKEAQI